MQEGILSLMQMPRATVAIAMLHDAGLPYIVVLTDPTTGGVTASYAMLGDVQIAEPGALIGFAGARVIEQTIREKLPEGFQRAEYLLDHGMLDMVVHRRDAERERLAQTIGYLTATQGGVTTVKHHPHLSQGRRLADPVARHETVVTEGHPPPAPLLKGEGDPRESRSMPDHATSSSPAVQAQLDRLTARCPPARTSSGWTAITRLLARLGDPHLRDAAGLPCRRHQRQGIDLCVPARGDRGGGAWRPRLFQPASGALQRAHSRRRAADRRRDARRAAGGGTGRGRTGSRPSFFEATTAAAFLAFARTPAAATIVEVGLGGRLDATNVVVPVVTGIAALGHGSRIRSWATGWSASPAEKAGIAKRGVPLVTMDYARPLRSRESPRSPPPTGAPVIARKRDWSSETARSTMRYARRGLSRSSRTSPRLVGAHQSRNLALAIAMLRHQGALDIPEAAMRAAAEWAHWPARMQCLDPGPLLDRLPAGSAIWLDGAHNPSAAIPIAKALRKVAQAPVTLVIGMLANKDAAGVVRALAPALNDLIAVPVPGHEHHGRGMLVDIARSFGVAATVADSVEQAIGRVAAACEPRCVLVAGSLYLAGDTLRINAQTPD